MKASKVRWHETSCLLCGGDRNNTLLEAPDRSQLGGLWFAVVQCRDCGLCFTNPRPTEKCLSQFYPDDYEPHITKPTQRPSLRRSLFPKRSKSPPIARHGLSRLLDFGCGGGSFLKQMSEAGWQVTGIDFAPNAVERLREESGLDVIVGTLPHPELEPETFDALTMWHSLEHVLDPAMILEEACRLLVPGGKILVATPNIDSLAFRTFGHAWIGLDLPRHLTHFTATTLQFMLERAGFRDVKIRMDASSSWFRRSARYACQSLQATRHHRWLRGKPWSRIVAKYSNWTKQADRIIATAVKG